MICPYCSTDMEPIELNGKVFCSNCGLTIANNGPATPTNAINPEPDKISEVTTDTAEEVEFPVIPEVVKANEEEVPEETPEPVEPRKLEVVTEENVATPETWNPVTAAATADLGIDTSLTVPEAPAFESKIADLSIPTEEDFSAAAPTEVTPGSYVELSNPGNEQSTLEASGILLDILGEGGKQESVNDQPTAKPTEGKLNPVTEPEIPLATETKKEDDIYTLPSEVKVGLRNKKVKKTPEPEKTKPEPEPVIDPKTEKKVEKLETKIAEAPEPVVDLSPEDAEKYDPDTIDLHDINPDDTKSKVIKDYFSTAIEKDKTAHKTKAKKKKQKNSWKVLGIFIAVIFGLAVLGLAGYYTYTYYKPANRETKAQETAKFTTLTPSYIPEGYILSTSAYSDSEKTYETMYSFTNDAQATITYKQIKTNDGAKYISDYLLAANATFIEKDVDGTVFTEANKTNLLWKTDGFVYVIETKNFSLSNDLLYKMAESVK